jgi:hypothetical protein
VPPFALVVRQYKSGAHFTTGFFIGTVVSLLPNSANVRMPEFRWAPDACPEVQKMVVVSETGHIGIEEIPNNEYPPTQVAATWRDVGDVQAAYSTFFALAALRASNIAADRLGTV